LIEVPKQLEYRNKKEKITTLKAKGCYIYRYIVFDLEIDMG